MKNLGAQWYYAAYIIRHSAIDTRIRDYYRWCVRSLPVKGDLLDIVCGEGVFVHFVRTKGFNAHGIDFSREAIDWGSSWYHLTTLYHGSLQDLRTLHHPGRFDVVTFFEVLEHVDDIPGFLQEIKTVLKPGGYICLSVPFRERWPIHEFSDFPPNHLTRWNKKALSTALALNGFEIHALATTSALRSYHIFLGHFFKTLFYRLMGLYHKGLHAAQPNDRARFVRSPLVRTFFSAINPRGIKDLLLWPFALLSYPFVFRLFKGYNLMLIGREKQT